MIMPNLFARYSATATYLVLVLIVIGVLQWR